MWLWEDPDRRSGKSGFERRKKGRKAVIYQAGQDVWYERRAHGRDEMRVLEKGERRSLRSLRSLGVDRVSGKG